MIDFDIYCPNPKVEMFMEQLKLRLDKDYPTTKVYITSSNPYSNWLYKQYIIYNENVPEEQKDAILF